jgi:hypothetical protein
MQICDQSSCSSWHNLLSLVKGVSLGAEAGRSTGALEVSTEGRDNERSENDLSATARLLGPSILGSLLEGKLTGKWAEPATAGR